VCLVPGLVLAEIGAGGATVAAVANGVRVIILGGRSLRGDDRLLHPVGWAALALLAPEPPDLSTHVVGLDSGQRKIKTPAAMMT
jgi:hypothetical protein